MRIPRNRQINPGLKTALHSERQTLNSFGIFECNRVQTGMTNYVTFYLHISKFIDILSTVASELLILSLDLVMSRVVVMSIEMKKSFIGQILVGLIEKTPKNV